MEGVEVDEVADLVAVDPAADSSVVVDLADLAADEVVSAAAEAVGISPWTLLRNEEVKKELEVMPEQDEALQKLAEQGRGERPDFGNIRDMSEEERNEFFEKMRKEAADRVAKMKEQLEEVLFPEQIERLEEISLQVRGVQALADEKIAAALKISTAQKQELEDTRDRLQTEMFSRMRELIQGGDREAMREQFSKVREEMEAKVLAVLDSDQQKQFEEMKGEKFEMPEGLGRGGFGGGGGGRGFGGGGRGGPGGGRGGPGGGRGGRGGRDGGGRPQRPEVE